MTGVFAITVLCAGVLAGPSAGAAVEAPAPDPAGSSTTAAGQAPKMSLAPYHACWIRRDKSLWCLGVWDGLMMPEMGTPVRIGTATDTWTDVAAGMVHTCAVKENGTLWCWGETADGRLGDGETSANGQEIEQIGTDATWTTVVAGSDFTCGLQRAGSLWCWGGSKVIAPENGMTVRARPGRIEGTWTRLSGSTDHVCAVRDDASLWCWGANPSGQLGDGTTTSRQSPVRVGTGTGWTTVSAGGEQTCALRADRTLWCWGGNPRGGLGDGTRSPRHVPVQVGTDRDWVQLAAGGTHVCARRANGTVWCWGDGTKGQLGDGDVADRLLPARVTGDATWTGVWSGPDATCGVRTDDSIWCWGGELWMQKSPQQDWDAPRQVPGTGWSGVSAGMYHTCAVRADRTLWCWGDNREGQVSGAAPGDRGSTPVRIGAAGDRYESVAAGLVSTCAIRVGGSLWCWGTLYTGKDTSHLQRTPAAVQPGTTWRSVSAGWEYTCGVRTDGSAWCWGANDSGQLGDGTQTDRADPVQVADGGTWTSVSAGFDHACGVRDDGSLWCWGRNESGRLGVTGGAAVVPKPVQVPLPGPWAQVYSGSTATCGIRVDHTMRCWGQDTFTLPGAGDGTWQSATLGVYERTLCAIGTDTTLWCEDDDPASPRTGETVRFTPSDRWTGVSNFRGYDWGHTCGVRADATLWCWGRNAGGALGVLNEPMVTFGQL